MKKKLLVSLVALSLVFAATSCGSDTSAPAQESTATVKAEDEEPDFLIDTLKALDNSPHVVTWYDTAKGIKDGDSAINDVISKGARLGTYQGASGSTLYVILFKEELLPSGVSDVYLYSEIVSYAYNITNKYDEKEAVESYNHAVSKGIVGKKSWFGLQ